MNSPTPSEDGTRRPAGASVRPTKGFLVLGSRRASAGKRRLDVGRAGCRRGCGDRGVQGGGPARVHWPGRSAADAGSVKRARPTHCRYGPRSASMPRPNGAGWHDRRGRTQRRIGCTLRARLRLTSSPYMHVATCRVTRFSAHGQSPLLTRSVVIGLDPNPHAVGAGAALWPWPQSSVYRQYAVVAPASNPITGIRT